MGVRCLHHRPRKALTNTTNEKEEKNMNRKLSIAILTSFAFAGSGALFAHGNAEHVMGFARTVSADSVTVENAKHEMITVLVTAKTEIMKSKVKAGIADLKVGDSVVIHAEKNKDGKLEAEELQFGAAPAKK